MCLLPIAACRIFKIRPFASLHLNLIWVAWDIREVLFLLRNSRFFYTNIFALIYTTKEINLWPHPNPNDLATSTTIAITIQNNMRVSVYVWKCVCNYVCICVSLRIWTGAVEPYLIRQPSEIYVKPLSSREKEGTRPALRQKNKKKKMRSKRSSE